MALRKPLSINWEGKQHKLLVTMEVIDRVEDQINVGRLLAQQTTGDIRFSHVAKFIAILLGFMTNVLSAFFPEQKKKDMTTTKKSTAKAKPKAKT